MIKDVSLVFKIHQPFRLKKHGISYLANDYEERYFDNHLNKALFDRIASKCYWPATRMLLELVNNMKSEKKKFKIAFSMSGLFVEQAEKWHPNLIELFKQFPKNCTEFLGETYYHSLSSLYENRDEYIEQLEMQRELMWSLFKQKPAVVTNTELIYNNLIAKSAESAGFKGMFTEGVPHILGWRSPNYLYTPPKDISSIKILLRNRSLTDDIGYRFSAKWWDEWPLSAEKLAWWVGCDMGDCVNLYLDYETIGEHHWEDTGIFWFFKALPYQINANQGMQFATPSEILQRHKPVGEFDVFEFSTISWADLEMDTSAWLGNRMQMICFKELKELGPLVKKTGDESLMKTWRMLQTSDHMHNICTKFWGDGDVHRYFSYFNTPNEGFTALMEVIHDFKIKVYEKLMKN